MSASTPFEGQSVRFQCIPLDPLPAPHHKEQAGSEPSPLGAFLGIVTLCRPERANAFDGGMIQELLRVLEIIGHRGPHLRAVIVHGQGPHFCAGADLGWMRKAATLSYDENINDASLLSKLFSGLKKIPVPTVGMVHGSVMGGGVGLTACLDVVVASEDAKFALSEVKLGLAPAVIMPFLKSKMDPGFLRQHALNGQVFSAQAAFDHGLIQQIVPRTQITQALLEQVEHLLGGSPQAQRKIKHYLNQLDHRAEDFGPAHVDAAWTPVSMIAGLRTSREGQEGLQAFFAKSPAPWRVDPGWKARVLPIVTPDVETSQRGTPS